jgi:ATP-dependent Lon protease
VLIPARNEKDLADIPADLRGRIKVRFIEQMMRCGR